jgi:hypothetical protein
MPPKKRRSKRKQKKKALPPKKKQTAALPRIGDIIEYLFADGTWYRGEVVGIPSPSEISVEFDDEDDETNREKYSHLDTDMAKGVLPWKIIERTMNIEKRKEDPPKKRKAPTRRGCRKARSDDGDHDDDGETDTEHPWQQEEEARPATTTTKRQKKSPPYRPPPPDRSGSTPLMQLLELNITRKSIDKKDRRRFRVTKQTFPRQFCRVGGKVTDARDHIGYVTCSHVQFMNYFCAGVS